MNFLPSATETIVLGISAEKAYMLLFRATLNKDEEPTEKTNRIFFNGEVKNDKFSISLKVDKANNFLPQINGYFEPTSSGSLLFLSYALFYSTRVYLIFWSGFALITGTITLLAINNVWYSIASFATLGLIHWVAWGNFKLQMSKSREKILEVLR